MIEFRFTTFIYVLILIVFSGCGGNDKPLVPVSGQVTYGGGEWPAPGFITLTPTNAPTGEPSRPGSASFAVDGKFNIGSYKPGDGIRPGTYTVLVSCYDPAKMGQGRPTAELEYVPSDFKPENLVVEKGQDPIVLNLDVPKKK